MKKYIVSAIFALCSLFTLQATAWTSLGEVNDVISHNETYVIFTSIPDSSCSNPGAFYFSHTDPDAKDMFTIALAALMSGKKVKAIDSGVASECNGFGAAKLTHLWVTK